MVWTPDRSPSRKDSYGNPSPRCTTPPVPPLRLMIWWLCCGWPPRRNGKSSGSPSRPWRRCSAVGCSPSTGNDPRPRCADCWGSKPLEARRIVTAAEQACPRTDLHGQVLPPLLPGAAAAFAAGTASLRHVEVIARLLAGPAAQRLPLDTPAGGGSPDRRQDRRVHPDRAAQLGHQTDRHARPGRRRTRRRPGTRAGQRTTVDPQPERVRWPAQGPVRQCRALRSDRRGSRRQSRPVDRGRSPPGRATPRRSDGRGVRVRRRPRRHRHPAHHRWATPAPERAHPAGGPGEPGPGRDARLRWAHDPRRVPDAVLRRMCRGLICCTTVAGMGSSSSRGKVSAGQPAHQSVFDSYARLSWHPSTRELEKIDTQHRDNEATIARHGGAVGRYLDDGLSAWKAGSAGRTSRPCWSGPGPG